MPAILTKGLCKDYGALHAVRALDLEVAEGELFALLGVNGAGKTTTIRMLSCLLPPTSGDAWLLGQVGSGRFERDIITDRQKVKAKTNLSPQETAIAPNLSVRENLEFMARVYHAESGYAQRKSEEILAAFSLADVAKSRAKTLSGGKQRRLSIAMALISEPQILFLDEPTLGLDVLARRELWNAIKALKGKVTVILTTHYMEEAEALSDRIGIMSDGQLRCVGTAAELKARAGAATLEDAFVTLAQEVSAQ